MVPPSMFTASASCVDIVPRLLTSAIVSRVKFVPSPTITFLSVGTIAAISVSLGFNGCLPSSWS